MNIHDRGVFYYRLLKYNVREAQKIVCGQVKSVAEKNTIITRVGVQRWAWSCRRFTR